MAVTSGPKSSAESNPATIWLKSAKSRIAKRHNCGQTRTLEARRLSFLPSRRRAARLRHGVRLGSCRDLPGSECGPRRHSKLFRELTDLWNPENPPIEAEKEGGGGGN